MSEERCSLDSATRGKSSTYISESKKNLFYRECRFSQFLPGYFFLSDSLLLSKPRITLNCLRFPWTSQSPISEEWMAHTCRLSGQIPPNPKISIHVGGVKKRKKNVTVIIYSGLFTSSRIQGDRWLWHVTKPARPQVTRGLKNNLLYCLPVESNLQFNYLRNYGAYYMGIEGK